MTCCSRRGRVGAIAWALALPLGGCGALRDAATAHVDVAARAAGRELSVEQLAEWMVAGRSLPLQPVVAERVAHLWVDYVLFADRVLSGDSLTDSARVLAARWPDARQAVVARFHEQIIGERVRLDSAQLDSVFAAGDLRYVRHVLFRVTPEMTSEQVAGKRRQAEATRARLAAGAPWSGANAVSDDTLARARGGDLGVLGRGETVRAFEDAAYGLAPGQLSAVTETPFGFHVLQRPPLSDVRQAFDAGVRQRLVARVDSTFVREAEQRRGLRVLRTAPALVRRATADPLLYRLSGEPIARFRGGRVSAGDVVQWLEVLPPDVQREIPQATDDGLRGFVRTIAREAMLVTEAQAAGVRLSNEEYDRLRATHAREVSSVRTALSLDAAAADAGRDAVTARVDAYFAVIVKDLQRLVPTPRFLADQLWKEREPRVYAAGVARAYLLASALRASQDSAAGRAPGGVRP
ncbi:MAG TPA: peptidylprolyl isomerase [Gemmatimonadales bacterium]|nr:peptidylprolyl isomerase [Gemmatimonadales bacterium]